MITFEQFSAISKDTELEELKKILTGPECQYKWLDNETLSRAQVSWNKSLINTFREGNLLADREVHGKDIDMGSGGTMQAFEVTRQTPTRIRIEYPDCVLLHASRDTQLGNVIRDERHENKLFHVTFYDYKTDLISGSKEAQNRDEWVNIIANHFFATFNYYQSLDVQMQPQTRAVKTYEFVKPFLVKANSWTLENQEYLLRMKFIYCGEDSLTPEDNALISVLEWD